jgi:uncharacterized protein YjbJ (UPF0337 family)
MEAVMSANQLDAMWHELHGGLKARWGRLCGDTGAFIDGRREADIAHMQRRYGLTHEEAVSAAKCLRQCGAMDDWNDERSILGM